MEPTYSGQAATVYNIPLLIGDGATPDQTAALAHYLVLAPGQHPFWPHYSLFICHLRPIPGQTSEPYLRFPTASHDLMLVALNPEYAPWNPDKVINVIHKKGRIPSKDDPSKEASPLLTPINMSVQLDGCTDEQAIQVTDLVAKALATGILPCEPSDYRGGKQIWEKSVESTAQHIRTGGHFDELELPLNPPNLN